ncbi:MAG: polysaccharide biosynthesis C-terminal domain-containing protein [Pseudomonadota bacterium]
MLAAVAQKLKDETLRDAAMTFAIRVGSAGLAYGIQVFLARTLQMQEYGIYAALWTFTIVAAHVAVFGFSESSLRFIPRYMARGRVACAEGFLTTGFKLIAGGSILLVALGLAVLWLAGSFIPAIYLAGLLVVLIGLPVAAMELYLEGVCRSFGWFALAIVPGYLVRPLLIGLAVVLWALSGHMPDAAFVLATALVITGISALAQAFTVYRRLSRMAKPVMGSNRRSLWLRASLPLVFVAGLEEIFISTDVLLLSLMGTPDEVALYFAAVRSMAIVNFVFYAFMIVSPRKFSVDNAGQDRARLQETITETSNWTFWLTVPAVAITLAAGYPLLRLFGPEFTAAYPVMALIALGYIARASVGPAADLLVVLGYQRASLLVSAAGIGVNVAFTIALYPVFGIAGVAAATAFALAFRAGASAYVARRHAGLNVFVTGWPALERGTPTEPVASNT